MASLSTATMAVSPYPSHGCGRRQPAHLKRERLGWPEAQQRAIPIAPAPSRPPVEQHPLVPVAHLDATAGRHGRGRGGLIGIEHGVGQQHDRDPAPGRRSHQRPRTARNVVVAHHHEPYVAVAKHAVEFAGQQRQLQYLADKSQQAAKPQRQRHRTCPRPGASLRPQIRCIPHRPCAAVQAGPPGPTKS